MILLSAIFLFLPMDVFQAGLPDSKWSSICSSFRRAVSGTKRYNEDQDDSRETKVEVADIGAHISILLVDHVRRPERRSEAHDLVHEDRKGLTMRPKPHGVHFCRRYPSARCNESRKGKSPNTEKGYQNVRNNFAGGRKPCTHSREYEHTRGHDAIASNHSETSPSIFDHKPTNQRAGKETQSNDGIDEERAVYAKATKENGGILAHKLQACDGNCDEDQCRIKWFFGGSFRGTAQSRRWLKRSLFHTQCKFRPHLPAL